MLKEARLDIVHKLKRLQCRYVTPLSSSPLIETTFQVQALQHASNIVNEKKKNPVTLFLFSFTRRGE